MFSRETVQQNLKTLRLNHMAQILDQEVETAERESLDALEVVGRLTTEQLSFYREARIRRYIKEARFPDLKTLTEFDWDFQPTLDKTRVLSLARLEFIDRRENALFAGNSGTGKAGNWVPRGKQAVRNLR